MNGNYPTGTQYDKRAPWNQKEIPMKEFKVCISQSLSKSTKVSTNDYYYDYDEEVTPITSNTNWNEAYAKEHYTPFEIIQECYKLCDWLIKTDTTRYGKHSLANLLEECKGWTVDETEIVED